MMLLCGGLARQSSPYACMPRPRDGGSRDPGLRCTLACWIRVVRQTAFASLPPPSLLPAVFKPTSLNLHTLTTALFDQQNAGRNAQLAKAMTGGIGTSMAWTPSGACGEGRGERGSGGGGGERANCMRGLVEDGRERGRERGREVGGWRGGRENDVSGVGRQRALDSRSEAARRSVWCVFVCVCVCVCVWYFE